ncbi:TonB-dependent receptor [Chitinimonas taiwanensis]|uniref:TonB-dependent receptor n=1 Tax=Chitinimonas taiwanensis TaxID=240412 RepID=UPI0035B192C4
MKLKKISYALLTMGVAGFAHQALAADAPQVTERITVTGSNIKRINSEGPLPVEVIKKEDIQRKGVTSTNDLLRSLANMSSFNDELTSNSPNVSGTASAGFRGLAGDQTVVLLNGRRMANYGFDGQFVDLNTIPLGAIERVEVLKDGAAAIYGADAIGGVINFITRRDYQGIDASFGYGVSQEGDGQETTAATSAGFGDYSEQGFNVLINANYFKREEIMNVDRERTRTGNYSRFGGNDQRSTYAPTGNFVNPTTGQWQPYLPCPSTTDLITPSPLGNGTSCLFDFSPFRPTVYPTERKSVFATGSLKLSEQHRFFAEFLYSQSNSDTAAAPAPAIFTVPAAHPTNTFGVPLQVRGRPLQAGARTTDNEAITTRVVLGLDGQIGQFDYNIAAGQAKNEATNKDGGYLKLDGVTAGIANGTFNPFATTNSQAVMDALAANETRKGETTYSFAEGKISGEVMDLPAGALGFAVGLVAAKEELSDVPSENQVKGNVFGSIAQSIARGSRDSKSAYLELGVPILKNLEAQLAVRHDRYEGGTNSTTPKVAVRFQPVKELLLRASYSEGFKMPSLRDLFGGKNQSADSVQDFPGCAARNQTPCPRLQYDRFSGGNPQLDPEKSDSINLGFVFEPNSAVSIGADYFIINKEDEIGLVPTQYVLSNTPYVPGAFTAFQGALGVERNAVGTVTRIETGNGNLGTRKIRGIDFNTKVRGKAGPARIAVGTDITYYNKYEYADLPGAKLYGRLGLLNLPRYKSVVSADADFGSVAGRFTVNTVGAMYDKPQSTASTPVTAADRRISSFTTVDFSASYKGIKGMTLAGGIKNLLNAEPDFSNNDPRTLGFAQVHDIRGRYFYGSVAYQFQ